MVKIRTASEVGKRKIVPLVVCLALFLGGCSSASKYGGTDGEIYAEARESLDSGSYREAIKDYDVLQSKFPYGIYSEQAWLDKAYAWFILRLHRTSELELREFIQNYPNHKNLDYAYFMLALNKEAYGFTFGSHYINDPAQKDVEKYESAYERYADLIKRYPNSPYSKIARQRRVVLLNRFARHNLNVARSYFERRAWVAVIKRCQYIIDSYPKTKSSRQALVLMRDSYSRLKLDDVARDVQKVIDYNKQLDAVRGAS